MRHRGMAGGLGWQWVAAMALCLPAVARTEGLTDQLADNSVVKLEAFSDGFLQEPLRPAIREIEDQPVAGRLLFSVETNAKLTDRLSFAVGGYVAAADPNEFRGAFTAPESEMETSRYVDLTSLQATWRAGWGDVTVGKGDFPVGYARLYSVADRFDEANIGNPVHPIDTGIWQATTRVFLGADMFTVSVQPFDTALALPLDNSRWLGLSTDGSFYSLLAEVDPVFKSAAPENWDIVMTYQAIRQGFDFFLLAHHGRGAYFTVKQKDPFTPPTLASDFVKARPEVWTGAAGIDMSRGPYNIYGELLVQVADNDEDDDMARGIVGVSFAAPDIANGLDLIGVDLTLEYAWESVFDRQKAPGFLASSENARPFPNSFLSEIKAQLTQKNAVTFAGAVNFDHKDYAVGVDFERAVSDRLTLGASASFFGGPTQAAFGRWRRNDFVGLRAKWILRGGE